MSKLSQEAALKIFNSMDPIVQETFHQLFKMLKIHLSSLGFKEVEDLLGQEYATCSIVGRGFVSNTRVLFVYLRVPDGDVRLEIFQIEGGQTDKNSQAILKFGGHGGFGDFCYSHIEGLRRTGSAQPGTREYLKESQDHLKVLLESDHLDWILRGKFWHNYEFDLREHMIGDFNDRDLREGLLKSLKDQGLEKS